MRVLHFGKFFLPYAGGMERFLALLLAGLARRGVEQAALVHAAPWQPRAAARWTDSPGAWLEETRCFGQLLFVPISPGWPLRAARLIKTFKPDLLHLHVPNPSVFALSALPAARQLPWVLHWHADVPLDAQHRGVRLAAPLYRLLERRLLQRAARVIATSQTYAGHSPALITAKEKVTVIPLGLDSLPSDSAAPLAWPSTGLRVLAVGRLSYYKGFDVLLRALAEDANLSLLLIGDGERRVELHRLAHELHIEQRVYFAGAVDDATLAAAYRDCDVLCLPSIDRAEAFGLVLLEAMRASKPVVASALAGSGMTEVVANEETGLLAPAGEPAALARALRRLRDDASLRQRMGAAGHARWQARYHIDVVSGQIENLYRELLALPT